MKPMKQEWRKMKPIVVLWSRKFFWERRAMWVESFAGLFIHQYISSDCIGLDGAIEPEFITRSTCEESSKRKIAFEERVKYWCDCGYCDSKCVGLSIWSYFDTHLVSLQNPPLWSCLFEFFLLFFVLKERDIKVKIKYIFIPWF